jgi:hypothetical protein
LAAVYFMAAATCLLCSAVWHTKKSIADLRAFATCTSVDLMGISLLISASLALASYIAFYGHPAWQLFYLGTSALGLAAGLFLPWTDVLHSPECAMINIAAAIVPRRGKPSSPRQGKIPIERYIVEKKICFRALRIMLMSLSWNSEGCCMTSISEPLT